MHVTGNDHELNALIVNLYATHVYHSGGDARPGGATGICVIHAEWAMAGDRPIELNRTFDVRINNVQPNDQQTAQYSLIGLSIGFSAIKLSIVLST